MRCTHHLRLNGERLVQFNIRIADGWRQRAIGLLGTRGLAPDRGLWIAPCNSVHMIGMLYPIDLVYLDASGLVLKLVHGLRPWRLSACPRAKVALELGVGTLEEIGLRSGDLLALEAGLDQIA